ncbi:GNAT family N-acetyltransferase [Reichenbachiella versicolor]|uniref:GNAT family N-acetyltransferase n=1 Tax=Reichenbachiella versicolor TaxID=1821036 RepID=UPI000D6DFB49|nr:GNAT family N-acetyltransferase [Reichenbachiella versicolor]
MNSSIEKNIYNLTSLWQTVGEEHQSFFSYSNFEYSIVPHSQWPNRLWFTKEMNDEAVHQAKSKLESIPEKLIVPIWDMGNQDLDPFLNELGVQPVFQQIGMSLEPKDILATSPLLKLIKVSNEAEATVWSETFLQSFGYKISSSTLLKTYNSIDYFLVHKEGKPVGTVITFETKDTLGIHAMGVIPQYRKQGIANEIMGKVINAAIEKNISLLTLQASDMGKGLYLKLGFQEEFLVRNCFL